MLPAAAPPAIHAPAPAAAALRTAGEIHREARKSLESPGPGSRELLQRLRSALVLQDRHLGRAHPLSLATRGLYGLMLDQHGDPRGLRLHAEACGELYRLLKLQQRYHGPASAELLPALDGLSELYGLASLPIYRWEDQALPILVARSGGLRADLERRVVAALTRHYGPWLSFRPPDREGVLADVGCLLALWSRRKDPQELSRVFAETALRSDAAGVWRLVAEQGGAELAEALQALLERLDPDTLAASLGSYLEWMGQQKGRPWEGPARELARGMEALAEDPASTGVDAVFRRVHLALALDEAPRAGRILAEALEGAAALDDFQRLLPLADRILEGRRDADLDRALQSALSAWLPELLSRDEGWRWVESTARRLERNGALADAERLWRALVGRSEAAALGSEPALWGLGRNLTLQGRWAEARAFLVPLRARSLGAKDASLDFLLSDLDERLGEHEVALLHAREGLGRLAGEGKIQPQAGLAAALRRLDGDPPSRELRASILLRLRRALDPEGTLPSLADPGKLLQLAGRLEAPGNGAPSRFPCGEPWVSVAVDPVERAEALLRSARELPVAEARPCLEQGLRLLEGRWGSEDPRLIPVLLQLGRLLGEAQDPAAEPVFRRILALAERHPEGEAAARTEALGRLGQLFSEQGRGEAAEALLREALKAFAGAPPDQERTRETAGAVVMVLLARLEDREDYAAALELMDQAEVIASKLPGLQEDLARDFAPHRKELERKARLMALLRAKGLP